MEEKFTKPELIIGPMATTVNGRVTLVGVVSFGAACGKPPYPGVYAKVTKLKSWILSNSDAGRCQN
jgi:secreted trypsin-like serine protease